MTKPLAPLLSVLSALQEVRRSPFLKPIDEQAQVLTDPKVLARQPDRAAIEPLLLEAQAHARVLIEPADATAQAALLAELTRSGFPAFARQPDRHVMIALGFGRIDTGVLFRDERDAGSPAEHQRRYSHVGADFLAGLPPDTAPFTDSVVFGAYNRQGFTDCEIAMAWTRNDDGELRAMLEIDQDAFGALPQHQDVFAALAAREVEAITPTEFCALLSSLGFTDATTRS